MKIIYELNSNEYMTAIAKAFGLSEYGIHSMTITASYGEPVIVNFHYNLMADQRLIQVTIPRIPSNED
jgi:hypothetical protein